MLTGALLLLALGSGLIPQLFAAWRARRQLSSKSSEPEPT
jgi:hypothetical protein